METIPLGWSVFIWQVGSSHIIPSSYSTALSSSYSLSSSSDSFLLLSLLPFCFPFITVASLFRSVSLSLCVSTAGNDVLPSFLPLLFSSCLSLSIYLPVHSIVLYLVCLS